MSEYFNIMGIDPGNNLGITIITVEIPSYKIVSIFTKTIILDNLVPEYIEDRFIYRLLILQNIIYQVYMEYLPVAISLETAFLNMSRPKAVIQLYQYLGVVETVARTINPFVKILKNMPKAIKKLIGAGGGADKLDMKEAVKLIPDIANIIDVTWLSEHEVDSIAMAYLGYIEIRNNPMMLCMV